MSEIKIGDTVHLRTDKGLQRGKVTNDVPFQPDWLEVTLDNSEILWWPKSQMKVDDDYSRSSTDSRGGEGAEV